LHLQGPSHLTHHRAEFCVTRSSACQSPSVSGRTSGSVHFGHSIVFSLGNSQQSERCADSPVHEVVFHLAFPGGIGPVGFLYGVFLLAMPAALIMKKAGYKAGFIIGLLLFGTGAFLFWPAASRSRAFAWTTATLTEWSNPTSSKT
jgi:hypothetical protein